MGRAADLTAYLRAHGQPRSFKTSLGQQQMFTIGMLEAAVAKHMREMAAAAEWETKKATHVKTKSGALKSIMVTVGNTQLNSRKVAAELKKRMSRGLYARRIRHDPVYSPNDLARIHALTGRVESQPGGVYVTKRQYRRAGFMGPHPSPRRGRRADRK